MNLAFGRALSVFRPLVTLASLALVCAACEPTPAYLQRWANTPGSEDRFAGYLLDSDLSHEVHVKALELLVEQWDHSSGMLFGGGTLKQMEPIEERNATIADASARIRELYDQGGVWSHKMRDAAYHIRQATGDATVQAPLDAIIIDWVVNQWDPRQTGQGLVRVTDLLNVIGPEAATPKLLEILTEGAADRVLCLGREVNNLDWLEASDAVAQAYIDRWERADVFPESEQLKFEFLEHLLRLNQTAVLRAWMFEQLDEGEMDALHKNAILDTISDNPSDSDVAGYTSLLDGETNARWAAFQAIVNARGSDGLELAISNLPVDGEYGFYDGAIREDGFKSAAENIVCVLPKLSELGDNARLVFQRHIDDANINSRLLSIACLASYGDSQTVQRLNEVKAQLGRTPVPAPRFGQGATLQSVIDATIASIQERAAR